VGHALSRGHILEAWLAEVTGRLRDSCATVDPRFPAVEDGRPAVQRPDLQRFTVCSGALFPFRIPVAVLKAPRKHGAFRV